MEHHLARFTERNAQVLGISVDSIYSHQAFAKSLGGLSFPLLSDFHPKGEVAKAYGIWRPDKGYAYRAQFIVDYDGMVRFSKVYSGIRPDPEELLAALDQLHAQPE